LAAGSDAPSVSAAQLGEIAHRLAVCEAEQGRLAEAETAFERALSAFEKAGNPGSAAVAALLHDLAILYFSEGRYAEAEEAVLRSLALISAGSSWEPRGFAGALSTPAAIYSWQN
jgi:tetratricopeptide (TPR) repeat protein